MTAAGTPFPVIGRLLTRRSEGRGLTLSSTHRPELFGVGRQIFAPAVAARGLQATARSAARLLPDVIAAATPAMRVADGLAASEAALPVPLLEAS